MKKQNLNFGNIAKSIFVFVLLSIFAQNTSCQNNNIKVTFITGTKTSFDYERAINPVSSGLVSLKVYNKNTNNNFTSKGVRMSGEYRRYLTKKTETLSGFYLAPNFSIGKHEVEYSKTTGSGLGLGLLFASIDIIADGDLDNPLYLRTPETITGEANITAQTLGLKIGYQKKWNSFTMDFGINLTKNAIAGHSKGLKLSDGSYQKFNSDLVGNQPESYFGIGFAF